MSFFYTIFALAAFWGFVGLIYPTPWHKKFPVTTTRPRNLAIWIIAGLLAMPFTPDEEKPKAEPEIETKKVSETSAPKTPAPAEKPAEPKEETWKDGTFIVGEDIEPGIYKSYGGYFARLKDLSGSFDSIIANGNLSGPGYVEIKKTDKAFQSKNGGVWRKIDLNTYKGKGGGQQEKYMDGIYLVDKEIEPGTYKVVGGYWARLRNVSGEFGAIIANENVSGSGYVTIAKSDFAIELKNGAILTKK